MRTAARECVLKYLYAERINDECGGQLFESLLKDDKLKEEDRAFARSLLAAVEENKEQLLNEIASLSVGFQLERMFEIDKCALLIGMAEIAFFQDIPFVVSVNEAVNLVSKYSTEKSMGFVNGILADFGRRRGLNS